MGLMASAVADKANSRVTVSTTAHANERSRSTVNRCPLLSLCSMSFQVISLLLLCFPGVPPDSHSAGVPVCGEVLPPGGSRQPLCRCPGLRRGPPTRWLPTATLQVSRSAARSSHPVAPDNHPARVPGYGEVLPPGGSRQPPCRCPGLRRGPPTRWLPTTTQQVSRATARSSHPMAPDNHPAGVPGYGEVLPPDGSRQPPCTCPGLRRGPSTRWLPTTTLQVSRATARSSHPMAPIYVAFRSRLQTSL